METIYTNIYDRNSQFSMMVASFLAPSDYRSKAQKFFGENASLTVLREGGGDFSPIITTRCVSVYSIVSRGKELELKISKLYPEVRRLSDNCSVIKLVDAAAFFSLFQVPLVPVHLFNKPVPGVGGGSVGVGYHQVLI